VLAGHPRLEIGDHESGDVESRALAEARLGALMELRLRGNPTGAVGIAALAGAPHLRRIERLHIGGEALPIDLLVRAPCLGSLRRLVLDSIDARDRLEPRRAN
jgi:hypothetical protein